jgi:transcriptional regulator with XRE-family HTH domain
VVVAISKLTIVSLHEKEGRMLKRFSPERIALRRKRMGKTQSRLSREIGISQVSICAIEKGRQQPRSETLARLSYALECPVDSFFV